ncbi:UNVERIFIED_CONTAM: hypothetical protein K2H54_065776 [Gekko kuhli]
MTLSQQPVSKRKLQPEARAAAMAGEELGGASLGKRELPLPPAAADEPVPSPPITGGEGDPQEKEEEGASRQGSSSHSENRDDAGGPGCAMACHFLYLGGHD